MRRPATTLRAACLVLTVCGAWGCQATPAPSAAKQPAPAGATLANLPNAAIAGTGTSTSTEAEGVKSLDVPLAAVPKGARWLLVGGGADPLSNPISLAQDLAALRPALPGPGLTLYASGPGAQVAIEPAAPRPPGLRATLERLFGPPGAASLQYTTSPLSADGPATSEQVLSALSSLLASDGKPLLIHIAGHGEGGKTPSDSRALLWGGLSLSVRDLAELLDRRKPTRRVRLIATTCFGGGFADYIFAAGDASGALRAGDQCGLFAAPWDDEASGCDPNPDRRRQESYALRLIEALSQPGTAKDLDGDGAVSLLEAHSHARVRSGSMDMPTTTSERWLRLRVPPGPLPKPRADDDTIEERFVIDSLSSDLGLPDAEAARGEFQRVDEEMQLLERGMEVAQLDADDRYYALRIALLERWPLLEHPHRDEHQALLLRAAKSIDAIANHSRLAHAYAAARTTLESLADRYDALRVRRARVERLVRAHDTRGLAARLTQIGGEDYATYQRLLRCERSLP